MTWLHRYCTCMMYTSSQVGLNWSSLPMFGCTLHILPVWCTHPLLEHSRLSRHMSPGSRTSWWQPEHTHWKWFVNALPRERRCSRACPPCRAFCLFVCLSVCLLVYLGNAHLARLDTQPVTDLVGQVCVAAPTEHLSIGLVYSLLFNKLKHPSSFASRRWMF